MTCRRLGTERQAMKKARQAAAAIAFWATWQAVSASWLASLSSLQVQPWILWQPLLWAQSQPSPACPPS